MSNRLPRRDDLAGIEPYGAPQLDVAHLLNVNENPYPASDEVVQSIERAVREASATLNRYPDREFTALRADLSDYLARESGVRVDAAGIWAANGSNEVMHQLFLAFGGPGRTALSMAPTYSMYPEYARDTFTEWVTGSRGADFTIDPAVVIDLMKQHRPSIVVLTSPNNPTGTALAPQSLIQIAEAAEDIEVAGGARPVIVVDEAYIEFRRPGVPSALELLGRFENLAVSRTMSKAFAFAGVRLGYLAAAPGIVDTIRIVRLPYHLSAVTQAVARAALANQDSLLAQVAELRKERDRTAAWLTAHGWNVAESDANFLFFGHFDDRHAVWQGLLDRGVLIRETGPDTWLRVSIGTPADMAAFKQALLEVTAS